MVASPVVLIVEDNAELQNARTAMAVTLKDWDRRLAQTRPGHPARLLESLGDVS